MLSSILHKIPVVIVCLMFLVAVIVIAVRSKRVTRSESLKMFRSVKLLTVWVLVFVFCITGVFAVFNHTKAKQNMSAIVSLNYSEASLAQNTNGTRFNMTEIVCDEVIKRAIQRGALEDVTVEQLRECLSVYPYVQGDVNDKANYHISTEFIVEYSASKNTAHLDSENVITLITGAYKEYYIEKYTDNFSLTSQDDAPDYSEMEYMDIVAYLNKEATAVLNYLYGMAEKAPSFVTSSNASFNSIAGRIYQFKESQIEQNLQSLILQYGIVRDKDNYVERLNYRNTTMGFTKQKNEASFNICNKTIEMYSDEMTRVVLVPTIDENGKIYMGRTEIGVDTLSDIATEYGTLVAENEKELMNNALILERIENAEEGSVYAMQADALVLSLDKTLRNLTVEAIAAGREYMDYKMNQCIAVNISASSLISEAKTIVIFAFIAYISAMAYELSRKYPKAKR